MAGLIAGRTTGRAAHPEGWKIEQGRAVIFEAPSAGIGWNEELIREVATLGLVETRRRCGFLTRTFC